MSLRWCFTVNNYLPDDVERISTLVSSGTATYAVFGYERGDSGTEHLQGFVRFTKQYRLAAAKALISPRAHLEPARGNDKQASEYCKKEGNFVEHGELPTARKGNDYTQLRDWLVSLDAKPSLSEVAKLYPGLALRHAGSLPGFIDHFFPPPAMDPSLEPRGWQRELGQTLDGVTNDREVIFIIDPEGNKGKSWFARWYLSQHPNDVQILSVGKRADIANTIDESRRVFLFDIERSQSQFLDYSILEGLKNGRIFSPKYMSRIKWLTHVPHVVVMMNETPDMEKLSVDRYNLIWLNEFNA